MQRIDGSKKRTHRSPKACWRVVKTHQAREYQVCFAVIRNPDDPRYSSVVWSTLSNNKQRSWNLFDPDHHYRFDNYDVRKIYLKAEQLEFIPKAVGERQDG